MMREMADMGVNPAFVVSLVENMKRVGWTPGQAADQWFGGLGLKPNFEGLGDTFGPQHIMRFAQAFAGIPRRARRQQVQVVAVTGSHLQRWASHIRAQILHCPTRPKWSKPFAA